MFYSKLCNRIDVYIYMDTSLSLSLYIYIFICVFIFIYIYREIDRVREREQMLIQKTGTNHMCRVGVEHKVVTAISVDTLRGAGEKYTLNINVIGNNDHVVECFAHVAVGPKSGILGHIYCALRRVIVRWPRVGYLFFLGEQVYEQVRRS